MLPEAQNNVGHLYEQGYGVSQNYTEAMTWYQQAADQGLAEAQHNVGMLYYHGYGVAENQRAAAAWFKRAAVQELAGFRVYAWARLSRGQRGGAQLSAGQALV